MSSAAAETNGRTSAFLRAAIKIATPAASTGSVIERVSTARPIHAPAVAAPATPRIDTNAYANATSSVVASERSLAAEAWRISSGCAANSTPPIVAARVRPSERER